MRFVDKTFDEDDGKYAYTNKDREIEGVELSIKDGLVYFQSGVTLEDDEMNTVYVADIPKMIKALEAAYQEYNMKKEGKQ